MATTTTAGTRTATPWGRAQLVERVTLPQRVGDKRFASIVELLELEGGGELLVRIAYSTGGTQRRGPVTLRARDIAKLHAALAKTPSLAAALGLGGGA
jgi:hypothetical protein